MISYEQIAQSIQRIANITATATFFILPISTSMSVILFSLTTLLILLSGHWKIKYELIRNNPIALYFLGFFILYLLGITYSIASAAEIKHQLMKFSWWLLAPLWMTLFVDQKWCSRAINAFLIAMVITLFLSFIKNSQWISNAQFWLALGPRLGATTNTVFKDYIIQSFLMTMAAMIFFYRSIKQKNLGYGVLFLFATTNIMFISQGRTGYIVFITVFAYTLFNLFPIKKALLTFILSFFALATLLIVLPGPIHERVNYALKDLQQLQNGNVQTSLGYRINWQQNALELVEQRPFIGYGTGSIKAAYRTLPPEKTLQSGIVDNASNEYLNITIQFGVIGLLLFLGLLCLQWRMSFYLSNELKFIMQILLIALCMGNFANSWLMDFTEGHLYALLTALVFAAYSRRPKPFPAKDRVNNDDVATDTPV